jgi:hypothetical protein
MQHDRRPQRDTGEAQVQPGIREKHSGGRIADRNSSDQPKLGRTGCVAPRQPAGDAESEQCGMMAGVMQSVGMSGFLGKRDQISEFAIGQTLTDHDVPLFGDFTWYVSAVVDTPLRQGQHTSMTLTPGIRTHVERDWYFLAGLPIPVKKESVD